jgi:DNA-directed RNA polymerase subunit K/omega
MSDSEDNIVEEVVDEPAEDEESIATSEGDAGDADIMAEDSDAENEAVEEDAEAEIEPEIEPEVQYERTKNQTHKTVIIIDPKNRKTSNMISKVELVEAIGIRAGQISQRATVFVDINRKDKTMVDDPIAIAKMEIAQRRCPLVLRRVVKQATNRKTGHVTEWVEDFAVNDMIYPSSLKIQ